MEEILSTLKKMKEITNADTIAIILNSEKYELVFKFYWGSYAFCYAISELQIEYSKYSVVEYISNVALDNYRQVIHCHL